MNTLITVVVFAAAAWLIDDARLYAGVLLAAVAAAVTVSDL